MIEPTPRHHVRALVKTRHSSIRIAPKYKTMADPASGKVRGSPKMPHNGEGELPRGKDGNSKEKRSGTERRERGDMKSHFMERSDGTPHMPERGERTERRREQEEGVTEKREEREQPHEYTVRSEFFLTQARNLVKRCKETIASYASHMDNLDHAEGKDATRRNDVSRSSIFMSLSLYDHALTATNMDHHLECFETCYNGNRGNIGTILHEKNGVTSILDEGFLHTTMVMKYNGGRDSRIMLDIGEIYAMSTLLMNAAADEADLIPQNEDLSESIIAMLMLPEAIMLHFFRCMYVAVSGGSGLQVLGAIVNALEVKLKAATRMDQVLGGTQTRQAPAYSEQDSPISGMFTAAKNLMHNVGIPVSDDVRPPSTAQVTGVLNAVFGNPMVTNLIKGVVETAKTFQPSGDGQVTPEEGVHAVIKAISGVMNPGTMGVISETARSTADIVMGKMAGGSTTGDGNSGASPPT